MHAAMQATPDTMSDSGNLKAEYISRINKTFDYMEAHLEKPFTLAELAAVAGFSKFHFTRIFQAMVGETPFQFLQRVRISKAASLLLTNRRANLSEIAYSCGFTDASVFARNFKSHYKVSASAYRAAHTKNSNLSQLHSNAAQPPAAAVPYFCPHIKNIKWRTNMELNKSVEIKDLPAMTLAYVRHTGPYKGDEKLFERLWNKLFAWAGPRSLLGTPGFMSLIVYHDDPNVTLEDKLRMSVCITVPPGTKVEGEIGKMELEAARYVVARFELYAEGFEKAWNWVYGQWFPSSGYQPDDKLCFEMYPEEPRDGKFTVDICVPVKPV